MGDAAGAFAVFCLRAGVTPQDVQARPDLTRQLQLLLIDQQVPLYWWDDVPIDHPAFAATQLLAVEGVWEGTDDNLDFAPDGPVRDRRGEAPDRRRGRERPPVERAGRRESRRGHPPAGPGRRGAAAARVRARRNSSSTAIPGASHAAGLKRAALRSR